MAETLKTIKERRSCRNFKPDMVPKELLNKVLEAGTWAPTGMGMQSPIIIAVTNKELRDKLSKMNAEIMGSVLWRSGGTGGAGRQEQTDACIRRQSRDGQSDAGRCGSGTWKLLDSPGERGIRERGRQGNPESSRDCRRL